MSVDTKLESVLKKVSQLSQNVIQSNKLLETVDKTVQIEINKLEDRILALKTMSSNLSHFYQRLNAEVLTLQGVCKQMTPGVEKKELYNFVVIADRTLGEFKNIGGQIAETVQITPDTRKIMDNLHNHASKLLPVLQDKK